MIIFHYLKKEYGKRLAGMFAIITAVIMVITAFDLLVKFASLHLGIINLAKLIIYKLPYLLFEITPVISLLAATVFINILLKSGQLGNIFSSGLSIAFVIKILCVVNLLVGVILLLVFSPISSIMLKNYQQLEGQLTHKISGIYYNVLLKERLDGGQRFLRLAGFDVQSGVMRDVMILNLDNDGLDSSFNCKSGKISEGQLNLTDCAKYDSTGLLELANYTLKTNIKPQDVVEYNTEMYYSVFWRLPDLISSAKKCGLSTQLLELYYYKQLFKPLWIVLFGIMPFCFLRFDKNYIFRNIVDSALVGLVVFLCMNISVNFLIHYFNSAMLASFVPILVFALCNMMCLIKKYKY